MNLNELASDYRKNAAVLSLRIDKLKKDIGLENMSETEKYRLHRRIAQLEHMLRYTNEAACAMEHYYDKEYHNGMFSV